MEEETGKRKYPRSAYDIPLSFSLSVLEFTDLKHIEASGNAVDKSEKGLGFFTGFPLEPGHVIRIKNGNTFTTALVKWAGKVGGEYRVGVVCYK